MTHHAPCDLFHDPDDDVTTVPVLTATQAEVVELLGLNPERRVRPRLTVHELATVDDVVRWAQNRLSRPRSVPGVQGDAGTGPDAAGIDLTGWRGTVDEEMTA